MMSTALIDTASTPRDGSSLTSEQIEAVRSSLYTLMDEHSARLRRADGRTEPTSDSQVGSGEFDRAAASFSLASTRDAIVEIGAALARLAEHTYGDCETCAQPIPFERLEAIPQTRFCVECARRRPANGQWAA